MTDVSELLKKYPEGFAVDPGGGISKTVYATSWFSHLVQSWPFPPLGGGYLVVEMTNDVLRQREASDEKVPGHGGS